LVLLLSFDPASLERTAEQVRTVDQRQSKRYRLRASVVFSSEQIGGSSIPGSGYTRDISPSGVFVFTSDPLPSGVVVNLEITLPSLRGQHSGACLRTVGHVVRTESAGFAAVTDLGFRMQFPNSQADESGRRPGGGNSGAHEVRPSQRKGERPVLASRFSM
jgi:hypothetical protein